MTIDDLNLKTHPYQNDEVLLLPYYQKGKAFPEDLFQRIHAQLISDAILDTIFCGMTDAHDFKTWYAYISKKPVVLYIVKPDTLVGFGWAAESEGIDGARKMAFGFGFFRSAHGTQLVRDLCFLSLRWWFEELGANILYASSLKTNHMAVNFSRNFGFEYLCELPMFFLYGDKLVDGHLICLKRDDFRPIYEEWLANRGTWKGLGGKVNGAVHLSEAEG